MADIPFKKDLMSLISNQSDKQTKSLSLGSCHVNLKHPSRRSVGSVRRALFTSAFLRQGASGNLAVEEPVTADELWPSSPPHGQTTGSPRPLITLLPEKTHSYLHLLERLFSHDFNSKRLLLQRPCILK